MDQSRPTSATGIHLGHFLWPVLWVVIANALAVGLNVALMMTTPLEPIAQLTNQALTERFGLVMTIGNIYSIVIFPIVVGLIIWHQWPVLKSIKRLRRQGEAPGSKARRRLLRFPLIAALLSGLAWLVPLLLFTVLLPSLARGGLTFIGQRAMMLVFVGLLASSVAYYGSFWALTSLIRAFFPDGHLAERSGLKPANTRSRLNYFYILVGALPLTVMWLYLYFYDTDNPLLPPLAIIAGLALLLGGWTADSLIIRLTRQLKQASEVAGEVRDGSLDGRIAVTSRDEAGRLGDGINEMIDGLVERERMREVFGRYVSPAVRDRLLAEAPRLGGELRQVTVLFADIRDFTVISGRLEPQRLVGLLNRYFATTVAVVDEYHGYVNKFIGDAVMAVFGAPLEDPEHTRRALECAREMVRRIEALNDTGEMEVRLRAGIGLHTGQVVAGNIGAPNRFEYTVIGEPVNVASRIQGLSAELGRPVLASAAVNEACGCTLDYLGQYELKGLEETQRVYAG